MYMLFFLVSLATGALFLNFSKKLLFLMILELLVIFSLYFYFILFGSSTESLFFVFYLMIFLVVDSVLGVSCLIYEARHSGSLSSLIFFV